MKQPTGLNFTPIDAPESTARAPTTPPSPRALAAQNRCLNCCVACKRFHRKCDNGDPCATCVQKKRPCIRERPPSPSGSDSSPEISCEWSNAPSPSSEDSSPPVTPGSMTLTIDDSFESPMMRIYDTFGPGAFRVAMNDAHLFIHDKDGRVFKTLVDNNNQVMEHMVIGSQRNLAEICGSVTLEELANPEYSDQFVSGDAGHSDAYNFNIKHHQQRLF